MPAHSFPAPESRYVLLQLGDGSFLTASGDGSLLGTSHRAGDESCWEDDQRRGVLRHHSGAVALRVVGGSGDVPHHSDPVWQVSLEPAQLELLPLDIQAAATDGCRLSVTVVEGPAALPSEYLATLDSAGWVCCPSFLGDRLLSRLRHDIAAMRADLTLHGSVSGSPGDSSLNGGMPCVSDDERRVTLINCVNYSPNFARMALHPTLLYLVESYIGTPSVRLAHSPAVGIMKPLGLEIAADGASLADPEALPPGGNGGGWHVDYPLHDMKPPYPAGVVLGLQGNFCIDDFTAENSTNFSLRSHESHQPPPANWNAPNEPHFPPFAPDSVDQFDCPGGSLILCEWLPRARSSLLCQPSPLTAYSCTLPFDSVIACVCVTPRV
jgi:hypothetical protein